MYNEVIKWAHNKENVNKVVVVIGDDFYSIRKEFIN